MSHSGQFSPGSPQPGGLIDSRWSVGATGTDHRTAVPKAPMHPSGVPEAALRLPKLGDEAAHTRHLLGFWHLRRGAIALDADSRRSPPASPGDAPATTCKPSGLELSPRRLLHRE